MYDDASTPGGYVDGGGYFGKFNGMIPRWSANPTGPGWNYGANAYQYQLWDVPFDFVGGSPLENVTFETALVNYTALSVNVMADFTWSFDTLTGALTGQQIAIQGAASSNLLTLYTSWFPGVSYTNGVLAPATVPEPVAWASMIFGLGAVGVSLRRRRSARRNSYV
jgi:hypothetical protein